MIKCFKLKTILVPVVIFISCLVVSLGIVAVNEFTDSPFRPYVIVIDAGHGGRDNGCSGLNGTIESEINLEITKKLQKMLKDRFETIDFEQAKQDVLPFVADKSKLELWSKDFFIDISHNIKNSN